MSDVTQPQNEEKWSEFVGGENDTAYRVIIFKDMTADDRIFLEKNGLRLEIIEAIVAKYFAPVRAAYASVFGDDLAWIPTKPDERCVRRLGEAHAVQFAATRHGALALPSPFSGDAISTNESYPFSWHGLLDVFYRFRDKKTFFLVTTGGDGATRGLYVPSLNLFVCNIPYGSHGWNDPVGLFAGFKTYFIANASLVERYSKESASRHTCMLIAHRVIGHYIMHFLPQVGHMLEAGLDPYVSRYLVAPQEFLPFNRVFPEIDELKILRVNKEEDFGVAVLEQNYFALIPNGFFVTENFAASVKRVAAEARPSFGQYLSTFRSSHYPIVWFGIRVNRRLWIEQEDGVPAIVDRLRERFPSVAVVIDGMTTLDTSFGVFNTRLLESDRSSIEKENLVVSKLTERFPRDVKVVNLVGADIWEKILWTEIATVFVGAFGSGFVWTGTIGNRPGVYHGNTYCTLLARQYIAMRENAAPHAFVTTPRVICDDDTSTTVNYSCDWKNIYKEVEQLIETTRPL